MDKSNYCPVGNCLCPRYKLATDENGQWRLCKVTYSHVNRWEVCPFPSIKALESEPCEIK